MAAENWELCSIGGTFHHYINLVRGWFVMHSSIFGPNRLSAGMLKGDCVYNLAGESVGYIKDLMIGLESGQVEYVMIATGGILGLGHKCFAVPWDAFKLDREWERLVLDLPPEELRNAPRVDSSAWDNAVDPRFADAVNEHYRHA